MRALITARFDGEELERLRGLADDIRFAGWGVDRKKLTAREMADRVGDLDILIVEFEPITEEVLAAARHLKALVCCRNEPEANVDVSAATALGIPVLHTPGRNAVSVAEYTIGLMLAVSRHIAAAHHLLRHTSELTAVQYEDKMADRRGVTSEWSLDPTAPFNRFPGPELAGKTLGLVGFGTIGRQIARRALAFDMRVIVADPYVDATAAKRAGAVRCELPALMRSADFVAIAAKVTPETTGLIGREQIGLMKPSAYFINTARAAIVDCDALHEALAAGRIRGAALDVFPSEPVPADSPFLRLDNAVLSPHLAGASLDIPRHHSRQAVDGLMSLFAGRMPHGLANPEVWAARRAVDGGAPGGR